MKTKFFFLVLFFILLTKFSYAADTSPAEPTQEDVDSKVVKSVKRVASGVAEIGVAPGKLVAETVKGSKSQSPVSGAVEGAGKGAEALVQSTVKGASKVATLGYGEVDRVDVEKPKADPGELDPTENEPTKFKIKIPGS